MKPGVILAHLRVTPFAQDDEQGRAAERYRRALLTVATSVMSRAMGLLVLMLSVRWTLPYLGQERFGAWMTVLSFASMLSFLDLGIGNALTNRVAHVASAARSPLELAYCISGGLGLLAVVSVMLGFSMTVMAAMLPWGSMFHLKTPGVAGEICSTVMVFAWVFAASTFFSGVAKVLHGLQRGFEVHLAGLVGSVLTLFFLIWAVHDRAGLPCLLLGMMGGGLLGNLGLCFLLALRGQLCCLGLVASIKGEMRVLLRVGGVFFLIQIGTMVGWGMDNLVVAHASGAASVAMFSTIQRLMQFVSQPLAIVNAPLWGAYADADARRERGFIRRTFLRSLRWTFLSALLGAILLALLGQYIIAWWTHGLIRPDRLLLSLMSLWLVLEATGNAVGVLLNGLGIVKQQVWVVSAFVLVVLPLKLYLASWMGAIGVVIAAITAYLLTTVVGYGLVFRRDLSERMI